MIDTQPLSDVAISDTGFIFDPHSGATFTLNPTGLRVVRLLKEGAALDSVAEQLRADFDRVPGHVFDDLRDFVAELRRQGLVGPELAPRRTA